MLTHRGFSAWIKSGDKLLPEYLVAVDDQEHRVSCWIPGVEGQTFTVCWQDHGGKVNSCGFIILDGLAVPGRFLFGSGVASRGGVRASKTTERPFTFQSVSESDEDKPELSKEAGMITLKIKRVIRVAGKLANPLQTVPPTTASGKRKAGDLCVRFGDEVPAFTQHVTTWDVRPYEQVGRSSKPSTFVSFVFRYRSPEFLEAQGIVEKPKLPPPPPAPLLPADQLQPYPPSLPIINSPQPTNSTLVQRRVISHSSRSNASPFQPAESRPSRKPRLIPSAESLTSTHPLSRQVSAEFPRTTSWSQFELGSSQEEDTDYKNLFFPHNETSVVRFPPPLDSSGTSSGESDALDNHDDTSFENFFNHDY